MAADAKGTVKVLSSGLARGPLSRGKDLSVGKPEYLEAVSLLELLNSTFIAQGVSSWPGCLGWVTAGEWPVNHLY